jgi:tetratricopeptide (TPR) repeat protein
MRREKWKRNVRFAGSKHGVYDAEDVIRQCRQWLVSIYEQQGKHWEAREQVQKLLTAFPDDEDIQQYCEEMRQRISRRSLLVASLVTIPTLLASGQESNGLSLEGGEDTLELAWDAFYTSNAQRSVNLVDHWLFFLEHVNTKSEDSVYSMRCRFLQLGSVLARDRGDFQLAFQEIHEAISLAFHLENAELIASSLYRRAKIYAEQLRYNLAMHDLEASLSYARRSRNPLRCYISIFLADMYSLVGSGPKEFLRKSLTLLDSVDSDVRTHGVLDGDGSFIKVDVPGLYIVRSDILRRAREIDESRKAVHVAQDGLPKDFIRWKGNAFLSEAQLLFADGDIENGCKSLLDALDRFQTNGSQSGIVKACSVYSAMQNMHPSHPRIKEVSERFVLK